MPEETESLSLDQENNQPKSKKKLIIIIVALVLVLAIAGAAAFFLLFNDEATPVDGASAEVAKEDVVKEVVAVNYVAMPRPLVFNVMEGKRDRTVQIKVQLMVQNSKNETLARKHVPLLESTLVRVFGAASAKQLRSPDGKDKLRQTALAELNKATIKVEDRALIHSVLFTGFVLQ